ncbi:HNH endonuclease [Paraburkholderia sprentiae WSM5005]|uniref:HNH endonuclease n=1 Tax=Paraburkholderia sprentiae WSM5005 TaxID=754502 RepID=A0A8F4KI66_9BURK|nr:hypothetical protein [Paraburkholderia sprentiae]QXE07165.1 HNH endonuclease [Paraburkholderia sprentiae WSM5005]
MSVNVEDRTSEVMLGKAALRAKIYAPVGRCIYCGSTEWSAQQPRKLGDEHIIPEGLGGGLVLPEASCQTCEAVTSAVELEWLRGAYHTARVQKELGKKKKRPPRFLPLQVHRDGKTVWESISLEKYPAMIVTLLFDEPEILSGCIPVDKVLSGGVAVGTLPTFGQLLKPYLDQGAVTFVPPRSSATSVHLGRMLAKIAHSYAVAELGITGFTSFLIDIILGTDTRHLSHYVGGTRDVPPLSDKGYEIKLTTVESVGLLPYLVVKIRLLSDVNGMPEYWVVVGERGSDEQFRHDDPGNVQK